MPCLGCRWKYWHKCNGRSWKRNLRVCAVSLHCCRLAMAVVYKPNVVAEGRGNSTPLVCLPPVAVHWETSWSKASYLRACLSSRVSHNWKDPTYSKVIISIVSALSTKVDHFFPKSIPGSFKGRYASILITGIKMLNLQDYVRCGLKNLPSALGQLYCFCNILAPDVVAD